MRAFKASLSIAVTVVVLPAFVAAQTTPPPSYPPPPANAPANPPPPGYQQPPPGYQQPPPGYQQPQQQPPPGYQQPGPQQPPPGYQQQPPPPPGYYPQQPPPPGYYPQQPPPPPGYYPPGYYPPPAPGYYPPPAPRPERPAPRTHGFLAMPYLGFHTFAGATGAVYSPGATLGALIGGRLNPSFSINGEIRLDALNFKNVPSSEQWDGSEFDIGISPLFHAQFPSGTGEFVIGPKLSFSGYEVTLRDDFGSTITHDRWNGWSAGFNAGVFFAVGRVLSLGGLMSFTSRHPTERCPDDQFGVEQCTSGDYSSENVFSFTGALLF